MKIWRLVFTDGRTRYLTQTLQSFNRLMTGPIDHTLIIDDSGDPGTFGPWLDAAYGGHAEIVHHRERLGYCRSVQDAWARVPADCTHVFHLEDDFVLERQINIKELVSVLDGNPHLCQVCLMRQPWYPVEVAAGSVYLHHGEAQWDVRSAVFPDQIERHWIEHHGQYWTCNPCVYRRNLIELGWPDPPLCEQGFRARLGEMRSAFWGRPDDPPMVRHIGFHTDNRTLTAVKVDMAALVRGF